MKKILGSIFVALLLFWGCSTPPDSREDKTLNVFVSILPQKFFVEKVGGEHVKVNVMVQPGQSPTTYEPTPQQLLMLANTKLYFSIGVPFEKAWLDKLQAENPQMQIVDTRTGIELREMDSFFHEENDDDHHHDAGMLDPHIWLSPQLVKTQVHTITTALKTVDQSNSELYEANSQKLLASLDVLSETIRETFQKNEIKNFMVFHPSWGYFADEFDLQQIPIEIEGKEPNARELSQLIESAKLQGIKTIFVQSQISTRQTHAIADAIGGKVVSIDPLAENYIINLQGIAETISQELLKND